MVNTGSQLTGYGSRLKRLKDYHEIRKYEKEKGGQKRKGVRLSLLALLGFGFIFHRRERRGSDFKRLKAASRNC